MAKLNDIIMAIVKIEIYAELLRIVFDIQYILETPNILTVATIFT